MAKLLFLEMRELYAGIFTMSRLRHLACATIHMARQLQEMAGWSGMVIFVCRHFKGNRQGRDDGVQFSWRNNLVQQDMFEWCINTTYPRKVVQDLRRSIDTRSFTDHIGGAISYTLR